MYFRENNVKGTSKPGGLDLSQGGLDQETRQSRKSQHFQKVSLDNRDISIVS